MASIQLRIERLETILSASKKITPGCVYITSVETLQEAKNRYKIEFGYELPDDAPLVEIKAMDFRKVSKVTQ